MDKELTQAAALIAVELLRRDPTDKMVVTPEVIASAFETAYLGLEQGIKRVEKLRPTGAGIAV